MVSSLVGATPQLFDLPGGWSWRSLRNLTASYFSGKRPRGGVSGIREGVLSLGGEHLRWDGTVDLTTPRRIPQSFADSMAGAELALEDILIVKDGATTGKTAFVRSLPERAFVNEHVFVLRPTSEVDAQYLFYWLWSRPGFQQIMLDVLQRRAVEEALENRAKGKISSEDSTLKIYISDLNCTVINPIKASLTDDTVVGFYCKSTSILRKDEHLLLIENLKIRRSENGYVQGSGGNLNITTHQHPLTKDRKYFGRQRIGTVWWHQ